jgi:hypothetical protein
MTAIVLFIVVHVTLALLVPKSLLAMITGGPALEQAAAAAAPVAAKPVITEPNIPEPSPKPLLAEPPLAVPHGTAPQ